jgi:hypothetical protein
MKKFTRPAAETPILLLTISDNRYSVVHLHLNSPEENMVKAK